MENERKKIIKLILQDPIRTILIQRKTADLGENTYKKLFVIIANLGFRNWRVRECIFDREYGICRLFCFRLGTYI